MALDLVSLCPQIEQMGAEYEGTIPEREQRREAALVALVEPPVPLGELKARVSEAARHPGVALAMPRDGLGERIAPPPAPPAHTVVALDGSQLAADRHNPLPCYLLNFGCVTLPYGQPGSEAILQSTPRLAYRAADIYLIDPDDSTRRAPITGALLHNTRNVAECEQLAVYLETLPADVPTVALIDNSLVLWGLTGRRVEPFAREVLLGRYFAALDRIEALAEQRPLVLAGYISRPDGANLLNTLRLMVDSEPSGSQRARDSENPFSGLVDRKVWDLRFGSPGERSPVYDLISDAAREYDGSHAVSFFYLATSEEVARVEVPAWVANAPERLGLLQAVLARQERLGEGYPVALQEAHEQAVVGGDDREVFWELVDRLIGDRVRLTVSPKQMGKQRRGL